MGSAEMQKESDACIKMVDKIVVVIDTILQVDSGGLLSRLAHVTNIRD